MGHWVYPTVPGAQPYYVPDAEDLKPKETTVGPPPEGTGDHQLPKAPSAADFPKYSGSSSSAEISVDTKALKYYAELLEKLMPEVKKACTMMQAVDARPGKFKMAEDIKKCLGGKDVKAAADNYSNQLAYLYQSLSELSKALKDLAAKYDTTEEMNSAGASKALGDALSNFSSVASGSGKTDT